MPLHHLKVRRTNVVLDAEQSFEVRGISADDLMALVATHGAVLALVYGKVQKMRETGERFSDEAVKTLLVEVAREFPGALASVIALATDSYDDEGLKIAKTLPLVVQIEAVLAVFSLTFASEAEVKKMFESLSKMLAGLSGALTEVQLPGSLNGIGASAAK